MSSINKRALRDNAESTIGILENIAGFEPSDIDGDTVELRFETEDGFDTGCDVSIVDQCQKAADVVRALLDELEAKDQLIAKQEKWIKDVEMTMISATDRAEAAEKRVAELEARGVTLPEVRITVAESRRRNMTWRELGAYNEGADVAVEKISKVLSIAGIHINGEGRYGPGHQSRSHDD